MAEITELLSPEAIKQGEQFIKMLETAAAKYTELAKVYDMISDKTRVQIKEEQELEKLNKLKLQTDAQVIKNEQLLARELEKKVIAQNKSAKELEKKVIAQNKSAKAAEKENSAYEKLNNQYKEAAKKAKDLAAQYGISDKRAKEAAKSAYALKQNIDKINASTGNFTGKVGGYWKSIASGALKAGAAFLTVRAAWNLMKNMISTMADFEYGMDKVKAVAKATTEGFIALRENAKFLGATTSKTALQVSQLQLEFAKLGFSTQEILNATEATINLSIAAGSDLATSAVVAASTIRGFGLNAAEAGRVTDVMALSFSSSALDLTKFQTSMAIAAPVAKSFGKDIEFTTAQLSVLADSGLDASTSGTSLRNIFLELSKRGMTWEEGLEKINTASNKNNEALKLFGKRGATAALILAENIEKATKLEKAYDGAAGSAKEMANIMEDNLIGDTYKLQSAWEGFVLGLNKGEGVLTNFFREAVQLVTLLVGKIQELTRSQSEKEAAKVQESVNIKKEEYLKKLAKEIELRKIASNDLKGRNAIIDEEIKRTKWLIDYNKKRSDEEADGNVALSFQIDNTIKTYEGYLKVLESLKIVRTEINDLNGPKSEEEKANKKRIKEAEDYVKMLELQYARRKMLIDEELAKEETSDARKADLLRELHANEDDLINRKYDITSDLIDQYKLGNDELANLIAKSDDFDKLNEENAKKYSDAKISMTDADKEFDDVWNKLLDEEDKAISDSVDFQISEEKRKAAEKKEIQKQYVEQSVSFVNSLFDLQQSRMDGELSALDAYYQTKIEAASNAGKNIEKLEAEYNNKRKKIEYDKAKSEQNQAIFNVTIQTAQNVVKAYPNPYLIAGALAIGLAQAAIIKREPLPAYAEGTDDAAHTFLAGEAGIELMKLAGGGYELATKPKIYSGSKYEHAEIFPEKDVVKMLGINQMNGLSMSGVERKLDRLIAKETAPVINIVNKHDYRYTKRYERMGR